MAAMSKHFVQFYSPGTFVSEVTEKPIDEWNVEAAAAMAHAISERHGATPYGFRFITRARADDELDSKQVASSGIYYLGGRVETLAEVEARNDPKEEVLRTNMRLNNIERVIINDNSWRFTGPFTERDTLLDWKPFPRPEGRA